jgi:hypothetical protein
MIISRGSKGKAMNPDKGYVMRGQGSVIECEVESETQVTATLLRCIFSVVVKSLS